MIPRAKQYKRNEGGFALPLIFPRTEDGAAARLILSRLLPTLAVGQGEDSTVTLAPLAASVKGEYALTVTPDAVALSYGDREGLRNAVATLASLCIEGGFPACEIADAPSYPFRSVMLDLARGYVELDVLYEHIVRMAYLKYNYLHLHLMDNQSYVVESEAVPNPEGHRLYTKDELRALCTFADELGIEVIPEIEFPTHSTALLRAIPELACDIIDMDKARAIVSVPRVHRGLLDEERGISQWAICLGQTRTYEIYDKIIAEIAEVFPSEYLHVGGDEIAYPHMGAVPHWDNCRACRARMEEKGLSDTLALYHDGFCRLDEAVRRYGKRMIKWNEQEELASPPPIPRDIIIEYWKPSVVDWTTGTAPALVKAEISMLREAGFEVFNAHYYYGYHDENQYMTTEKINGWTPAEESLGVMGGETCAWELGNPRYAYYAHRLPFGIALFSDRVWNRDIVPYDDGYRADLFAAALGRNGLGSLPLSPLPAVLSPIPHSKGECIQPLPEHAPAALAAIEGVREEEVFGRLFLTAYREYLASLIDILPKTDAPAGSVGFGEGVIEG